MIGCFASICPFLISGNSLSVFGEFCFRFQVFLFYATDKFLRIYYGRVKEYLSELSDSGEQLHYNPDEEGELFLDSEPEVQ